MVKEVAYMFGNVVVVNIVNPVEIYSGEVK